jgi:hypothetical protein
VGHDVAQESPVMRDQLEPDRLIKYFLRPEYELGGLRAGVRNVVKPRHFSLIPTVNLRL